MKYNKKSTMKYNYVAVFLDTFNTVHTIEEFVHLNDVGLQVSVLIVCCEVLY